MTIPEIGGNIPEGFENFFSTPEPEITPTQSDERVKRLNYVLEKVIGKPLNGVLYPGSGTDTSVAAAFGSDNVLHIDVARRPVEALIKSGYRAIASDVTDFQPDNPVRAIVLYRPSITVERMEHLFRALEPNGYVLVNNGLNTASRLILPDSLNGLHGLYYQNSLHSAFQSVRNLECLGILVSSTDPGRQYTVETDVKRYFRESEGWWNTILSLPAEQIEQGKLPPFPIQEYTPDSNEDIFVFRKK